MKGLILILFIIFSLDLEAQVAKNDKIFFSDALVMYLPKYNQKAKEAYRHRNFEEADRLFDTLVETRLKGTYIDDFRFKNLKNKNVSLYSFEKPVYLLTYASWCIPGKGEIPAMNELAKKYKDQIHFVILFWDKQETAKTLAKQFSKYIRIMYIDETRNKHSYIVENLKHSLGLPTCYLIADNGEIRNIKRTVFHPFNLSKEESYRLNYEAIDIAISTNLIGYRNK